MNKLRSVLCQLLKRPGFTRRTVFTLALGVGRLVAVAEGLSLNPPFSIQRQAQAAWLVRPNGERFFSLGICCVNQGVARKDFDPANPGYAGWQHYVDSNLWANTTVKRLKSWGFITVGGWSDFRALGNCPDADIGFAPVLHIGSTAGAPWWDMWDQKIPDGQRVRVVAPGGAG